MCLYGIFVLCQLIGGELTWPRGEPINTHKPGPAGVAGCNHASMDRRRAVATTLLVVSNREERAYAYSISGP